MPPAQQQPIDSTPVAPRTLAPDAAVDLQLHTTFSDGRWTAVQLLDHVAGEHFALIAITDHDRPDTIGEVQRLAAERGVRVVPAVEMSSRWQGDLCDILCFGIRSGPSDLAAIAADTRHRQAENVRAVYAALRRNGYDFPHAAELLPESAGEPRQLDDLMALMRAHGYADGMGRALEAAGFVWMTADLGAIVVAAHAMDAIALIAHPGRGDGFACFDADQLDLLCASIPIDGLEARHPSHTPEQVEAFVAYARAHGLLVSSGSDSHGPPGAMPIKYPAGTCRDLLLRLGIALA
ncbi:MAG: PHP domain-containing protein [Ktedonobacterales bacterium]